VTCGHTHLALEAEVDGVRYVNSGTWTEAPPCPFVVVQGDHVGLEYWPIRSTTETEEPAEHAASPVDRLPAAPPIPVL
jgi:hypothetical protein